MLVKNLIEKSLLSWPSYNQLIKIDQKLKLNLDHILNQNLLVFELIMSVVMNVYSRLDFLIVDFARINN